MIDKNQAKPLYQVVAGSLLNQIESGEYQPGERLPSESELCRIYDVGRNTIRHALSELSKMGVLRTVHGVGTFVAENRLSKTAQFLYGLSQEMALHGKTVTSEVLDARIIPADPYLTRRLEVQLGAEVVFIYRLRLMDGEPTALERAYLPHQLCPEILRFDFSEESLYQVLSAEYNMKPDNAEQEIEAELATDEVAHLFGVEQPAVVLVFRRETRTQDGRVIEYVDSEFRADRYRFFTHLKANALTHPYLFERLPVNTRQEQEG